MRRNRNYISALFIVLFSIQQLQVFAAVPESYKKYIHQRLENKKAWYQQWCENLSVCRKDRFDRSVAIVIGVWNYKHLKPLSYTKNNPREMKEFLLNEALFDEVIYLTEADASFKTINWFMENYIPELFQQSRFSRFVFYFSGHGDYRFPKDPEGYLRLQGDSHNNWDTSLPMTVVARWAKKNLSVARHSLFLLDSCFSGLAGIELMNDKVQLNPSLSPQQLMEKNATIIITAGKGDQETIATLEHDGSVFTKAVLTGLRGQADSVSDGVITSDELYQWVFGTVKNAAEDNNKVQEPQIYKYKAGKLFQNRGPFIFRNPKKSYVVKVAGGTETGGKEKMGSRDFASLIVNTIPANAVITLLDSDEAYFPGVGLPQGNYELEITAPGYYSRKQKVAVLSLNTRLDVELVKKKGAGDVYQDPLKSGGSGPSMVVVAAGFFQMGDLSSNGDNNEKPVHTVTISRQFSMSRTEITFADYDRFVKATGYEKPGDNGWGREDRPVIDVNWSDANAYAKWLSKETGKSYRLPSEAEWEYAARAGSKSDYPWGDQASHAYANYGKDECCAGHVEGKDQWKYTAPVGKFPANDFGLYDMQGNVWEWVQDCWNGSYVGAPVNGSAWMSGGCEKAVLRGGSWSFNPRLLRSSYRFRYTRTLRFLNTGFRLVQD